MRTKHLVPKTPVPTGSKRGMRLTGRVEALNPLAPDVVEVVIETRDEVGHLPGQYYNVTFRGFPARSYCPTVPLERFGRPDSVHLHVRRIQGGRVSSAMMQQISVGHRVSLEGPFGSAYLRNGLDGRLILVASGTGFAQIWSIADAAMRENYERDLVLIVSIRDLESLYMIPALWRLAGCPNVKIIPVTETPHNVSSIVETGTAAEFIPELWPEDIVYAAGAPAVVGAVEQLALSAGATCYTQPFTASEHDGLMSRAIDWLWRHKKPVRTQEGNRRRASVNAPRRDPARLHARAAGVSANS